MILAKNGIIRIKKPKSISQTHNRIAGTIWSRLLIFLHCLPAKRGIEVTDEVMDSPQSTIVQQAENRMHAQKGLLVWLLGGLKSEYEKSEHDA